MNQLSNFTFEEITIGQTSTYSKRIDEQDILMFAAVSGDVNPVHLDEEFASGTMFKGRIAHGMLTGAIVSASLGMVLPGPGTIYLEQSLRFSLPVRIGDEITVVMEVTGKREDKNIVTLDCKALNQNGQLVASGQTTVIAPSEKISIDRPSIPDCRIIK
jgi:acyl dehydratase